MIELGPSHVATTDVESGDDEEIFDEEMAYSYKIMYEKLAETVIENRGMLLKISQLCREKNELVKQVNMLKNENEEWSETKHHTLTNYVTTCRNYHHKGGRKNHSLRRQRLRCYCCKKLGHIKRDCSHFLMHQKVREQQQQPKTKQIWVVKNDGRCLVACTSLKVNVEQKWYFDCGSS